ncbi:hypothetical protein SteCoe_36282 [Stentor coeruleus]|uniref:Cyclic nucleotide-binding domain-containing protein n=1 Tax=Stentor coeruleus TaxID=5963 RepID=A0A1R2AQK4_9CILI|nr:hypothetical protein SteCoe_36282 [Stentor coeruleus]
MNNTSPIRLPKQITPTERNLRMQIEKTRATELRLKKEFSRAKIIIEAIPNITKPAQFYIKKAKQKYIKIQESRSVRSISHNNSRLTINTTRSRVSPTYLKSQVKFPNTIKLTEFIPEWLLSRPDFKEAVKAMEISEKERIPLILDTYYLNRSEDDKKIMNNYLSSVEFFHDLPHTVIAETGNRLFKQSFSKGEKIITKGIEADCLCILYKGSADVIIDGIVVASKYEGDVVGELTLDYRMPRSADVVAITDCLVFKLMRDDYEIAILNIKRREKQKNLEMLKRIKFFNSWTDMKLLRISTLLNTRHFKKDTVVYERNDPSTCLYFVQEGSVDMYAYVPLEHSNKWPVSANQWIVHQVNREYLIKIGTVTYNQYFGECELKTGVLRTMKAVAHNNTVCLILNKEHFFEHFTDNEINGFVKEGFIKMPTVKELQEKITCELESRVLSENALLDALKVNFSNLQGREDALDPKIKKLNPWLKCFRKRRTESLEFLKKKIVYENSRNINIGTAKRKK